MNEYHKSELERVEKGHDWNFNIIAVFKGTKNDSKHLNIPYKDWLKIKDILINSNLN
jgi:hypothetical protein